MPRRYYSSTAQRTTLASSCSNSDTTLSVTAVSGWPSSFPYTICIDQDTINEELVSVTARSGTTLTVTRGIDGTAAVAHSAGATVNHAVSAQDFNEPNQFLNEGGTVAGPTLVTANSASNALEVRQTGAGNALVVEDSTNPDSTPFVVNASGNVGIGTSSPASSLDVSVAANPNLYLRNTGDTSAERAVTINLSHSNDVGARIRMARASGSSDGAYLAVDTEPVGGTVAERMRIDSSGNVGIGTAPSFKLETYDASSNIAMVRGDSGTALFLRRGSADANGPDLNFNKARNTSSSPQSVSASDVLGNLVWRGHDGTQYVAGAAIIATVDGTPGTNDMPGRLSFQTTPDGSATLTERMRIDSAGSVNIGDVSGVARTDLTIQRNARTVSVPTIRLIDTDSAAANNTNGALEFFAADGSTPAGSSVRVALQSVSNANGGASDFRVLTNDGTLTERMRITNAGNVGIGTNSPIGNLHVQADALVSVYVRQGTTDSGGSNLNFDKTRGTFGSPTVVASGDALGTIWFRGYDGGSMRNAAAIQAVVDATPGSSDMPGRLSFYTTADGSASLSERMKIDNAGLITGTGTSLGAWTAYTPTLGGTGWAIGNGSVEGHYCQIGKTVFFTASISFGSTSTFGAGQLTFTAPINHGSNQMTGRQVLAQGYDASTGKFYMLQGHGTSTAGTFGLRSIASGTAGEMGSLTSTAPITWANGDIIRIHGFYEAA